MQDGRSTEIVDELMETVKFDKHVFPLGHAVRTDAQRLGAR